MVDNNLVDLHLLIDSLAEPLCVISLPDKKIIFSNKSFVANIHHNVFGNFVDDVISSEYDRKHLCIQLLGLSVDNPHCTILAVSINVNNGCDSNIILLFSQ